MTMHAVADSRSDGFKEGFRAPPRAILIGMILFLAALGMLFAASVMAYVLIRLRPDERAPLDLPWLLWLSTGLIVASSLTLALALRSVRRERQRDLRVWVLATALLAIGFVLVQGPCLAIFLSEHERHLDAGLHVYGLAFFLVLLHALHVIGGLVAMGVVGWRSIRGRYDHEQHMGLRLLTMYWHFLDAVWLIMFGVFVVTA